MMPAGDGRPTEKPIGHPTAARRVYRLLDHIFSVIGKHQPGCELPEPPPRRGVTSER